MKVLIISESVNKFDSGGKVVRYIVQILKKLNFQVKILVVNEMVEANIDDFILNHPTTFLPVKRNFYSRLINIFFDTKETYEFKKLLLDFKPDIVHFASFENSKPSRFILEIKKFGAKIVLQPWTMHFYCIQGFGFRNNQSCTKCAKGNYFNALLYSCSGIKSIPSIIEKFFLHRRALVAKSFLSSNRELDTILLNYGVSSGNIFNFPVPFDYLKSISDKNNDNYKFEDYFVYYGQVNNHKGLKILQEVVIKLPHIRFKFFPMNFLSNEYFPFNNVEIINNIGWNNGLKEYILNSKAVLIPSLWVSSTEYSLCEALLLKKPVVLFNTGIHRDLFVNRENAMVVELNDIDSLVDAISELNNDPSLCSRISENGYKTLINHNNIDKLSSELLKAYLN